MSNINDFVIKNGVLTNKLEIGDLTIFKPTSANQPYIQINKDGSNVFSLNDKELQLGSNDSYIKLNFINKIIGIGLLKTAFDTDFFLFVPCGAPALSVKRRAVSVP